jgi:hypothetical protein
MVNFIRGFAFAGHHFAIAGHHRRPERQAMCAE